MKSYLQKVVYCTDRQLGNHTGICDKNGINAVVISWVGGELRDIAFSEEGVLYITDNEKSLRILKERNLPVAVWLHEDNGDQDLSDAFYALESPEALDMDFFEKIYRREKGIPWEIVETDRCLVREMVPEDGAAFAEIYKEPVISGYARDFHGDQIGEEAYIREYQQQYRFFEYGVWSVVLKETGEVIGRAGFSTASADCMEDVQTKDECNAGKDVLNSIGEEIFALPQLGYMIGVPWQRQGLAYEVCGAILEYAKEELDFEKIALWVEESNQASRKLCEKLGFFKEKIATPRGWCYYEYACKE